MNVRHIFTLLTIAAFVIVMSNCSGSKEENESKSGNEESEPVEVADYMMKFQYFTIKLGLSIQTNNTTLAQFYVHELDEVLENLESKNAVDEELQITPLLKKFLIPAVDSLKNDFEKNNYAKFSAGYKNLIKNCNNCHVTAKHEFIVIEEPTQQFSGQNFSPVAK